MDRRTFIGTAGGSVMAAAAENVRKTKYYQLDQYFLKNGTQTARIHEFLKATVSLHTGPRLILDALVAPHMPQVAVIQGYSSLEECFQQAGKPGENPLHRKALTQWEAGEEAPYEQNTTTLLEATGYSPEVVSSGKAGRIFELRVYHSPTWRQLAALHERFAGPEIRIFHRVGVHPVLYTSTLVGANRPNLTYVIPFDSLAAREKAWNSFGADEEWVKVRRESIERHGQISSVIQMVLFKATDYSPVK